MTEAPPCLFALEATRSWGEAVAAHLGLPLQAHEERGFEDGEHKTRPLTGVRNRHELQLDLMKACSQQTRTGTPVTLLVIDLDFFKTVNDTYGHIKGDEVLTEIAGLMVRRLRATDSLYRYGGEEFLVLASGTDAEGGRTLAEDLRTTIENSSPCGVSGITISLGVAQYAPPESISAWLHRADEALYRAKANGRNRVELASFMAD